MDTSGGEDCEAPSIASAVEVNAKFADPSVPLYSALVVRRGLLGMEDGTDFGFFELAGLHGVDPALVVVDNAEMAFDLVKHVMKVVESMTDPDESKRVDLRGLG